MKYLRRFGIVILTAVLLLSAGTVSWISVSSAEMPEVICAESFQTLLEQMAVGLAQNMDPEFDFLIFKEGISEEIKQEAENVFQDQISSALTLVSKKTQAFHVRAKWKNEERIVNWDEDWNTGNCLYRLSLTSGKEGIDLESGNVSWKTNLDSFMDGFIFQTESPDERYASQSTPYFYESGNVSFNQIASIQLPAGFSVQFAVSPGIETSSWLQDYFQRPPYTNLSMALILTASIIVLLLIFLFPFETEEKAPVFKKFIRLKFIIPAVLILPLFFGFYFTAYCLSLMQNGQLQAILQQLPLAPAQTFAWLICFLETGLWLFLVSLEGLYFKQIFVLGPAEFFQKHTLLYPGLKKLQKAMLVFQNQELFVKPLKVLLVPLAVFSGSLLAALILVALFASSPVVFTMIWLAGCLLFAAWVLKLYADGCRDYQTVLLTARSLAAGLFTVSSKQNAGFLQPVASVLEEISGGFEKALKNEAKSLHMKSELISGVSHDLKTPITGIASYAQLIEESENLEQAKEYALCLEGYVSRLSALADDLFDLSKASSGLLELKPEAIDLTELLSQVQSQFENEFERKNLKVVTDWMTQPAITDLDPSACARIFENLFKNISKYAMENTRVFLCLKENNGRIEVVLKNMSACPIDFLGDEIIERFKRGDSSRHEEGSGLGLAIVDTYAKAQGIGFKIETDGDLFKAILLFPSRQLSDNCSEN